jgi:hypothetical protein
MISKLFLISLLSYYTSCSFYGYSQTDKDSIKIKLLPDKNVFAEGDSINLNIEFDFNRGDSIAYFYTLDFLFGVVLTDEFGQEFREISYFISNMGFVISPEIPVFPHEIMTIKTSLNCNYTTRENYLAFDNRCIVNLKPGTYSVKFDDYRLFSRLGRNISANTLTFKILPKDK